MFGMCVCEVILGSASRYVALVFVLFVVFFITCLDAPSRKLIDMVKRTRRTILRISPQSYWNAPVCATCSRQHLGDCKVDQVVYFSCGYLGHMKRKCPPLNQQLSIQQYLSSAT